MKYRGLYDLLGTLVLSLLLSPASSQSTWYGQYQSSQCSKIQFRCTNGQCIDEGLICDGHVDCSDRSDETRVLCKPLAQSCNPLAFVCDYGACIDGGLNCDGTSNCADNSDEKACDGLALSNQNNCKVNQFRCKNGECIDDLGTCDGNADCADGSDETEEHCKNFECPLLAFKCNYGACIDGNKKCDGRVDCVDGSDESATVCGTNSYHPPTTTSTRRPPVRPPPIYPDPTTTTARSPVLTQPCLQPPQPLNGFWKLHKSQCLTNVNCDPAPGITEFNPGAYLVYSCNKGFRLKGSENVFCGPKGQWSSSPICEEIRCVPLTTTAVEGTCSRQGENSFACDRSVLPGTIAKLACKTSYNQDKTDVTRSNTVKCAANGQWDPAPIKCIAGCGLTASNQGVPLVVNGSTARVADFPWHASLYRQRGFAGPKLYLCGGSIIRPNLVVTAAHCVYDEGTKNVNNPREYFVMTGNVFRDYDSNLHNPVTVKKNRVEKIYIVCNYLGLEGNYASDIAILKLETPFTFTSTLSPICLDTTGEMDHILLESGNFGKVAGFGRTASGETANILQTINLPYIPMNKCKGSVQYDSGKFITLDKFCAGYRNGSSVCDGDSGGGLAFQNDGLYYLEGIVSVGLGGRVIGGIRTCDSYMYSLYTRLSSHMEWITQVIRNVENNKVQPTCV